MRGMYLVLLKKIFVCIFLVVFCLCHTVTASASVTNSYSRVDIPEGTENRISKEMYCAVKEITARSLGLEKSLEGITDLFCGDNGDILLLLGHDSRLIRINSDYTTAEEIMVTDSNGNVNYKGARGVYSDSMGYIYIADTQNSRILILDYKGKVHTVLDTPVSDLIPEDFLFQPTTIEKDAEGYTYVLSLGCYYGALLYTPEYEFIGFYGANTVEASALDTLSYIWEKLTSTEEKKAASVKTLPYSFTDFCFDNEGFMITITGTISSDRYKSSNFLGHIRKISYDGSNILYKRNLDGESVSSSTLNFLESQRPTGTDVQDLVSVAVSDDGYIFVLDGGNGTVYIYDSECNLTSAFGGGYNTGEQLGVFKNAVAMTLHYNNLLVADESSNSLTLFMPTEYGTLLRQAQSSYLAGDYDEAKELWQNVLSLNRNCQLAYRGLAMAYYSEGDYRAALEAAEKSLDRSVYDLAWREIVSSFISKNFVLILLVITLIIVVLVCIIIHLRKKKREFIRNKKLKLVFKVPFHPFNSFDDLKYKKQGSVKLAIAITVLFYLSSVLNVIFGGFLYSDTLLRNYNSLYTLASTVGLILLWSVCNWLVCSMFSGKGNLEEVYVSTCYTLVPWVLFMFIRVLLTNFIPLSGTGIIAGIETFLLIYTFFLLSIAMIKVHEYDFFKFLLTGIVTLFFMILVVFIIFMCAILIMQFASFLILLYEEVVYR